MRHCSACGRPLTAEFHDEGEKVLVVAPRGRGRAPFRRQRTWGCRVRLTGLSDLGRIEVPASAQRNRFNVRSYKHESRFT